MRCLIILLLQAGALTLPAQSDRNFIDPTGTYTLTGTIKKHQLITHSGELRALLLDSSRVAMSFYMTNSYPDNKSGAFLDTLSYQGNQAFYYPVKDSGCRILFFFKPMTVDISQLYTDPGSNCGFPPGVLIATALEKKSSERPIIQDLSAHGISP